VRAGKAMNWSLLKNSIGTTTQFRMSRTTHIRHGSHKQRALLSASQRVVVVGSTTEELGPGRRPRWPTEVIYQCAQIYTEQRALSNGHRRSDIGSGQQNLIDPEITRILTAFGLGSHHHRISIEVHSSSSSSLFEAIISGGSEGYWGGI
jgi:hypothetical protein